MAIEIELAVSIHPHEDGCTVDIPQPGGAWLTAVLTSRQVRLLAGALIDTIPVPERREYLHRLAAPVSPPRVFAPLSEMEIDGQQHLFAGDGVVRQHHEPDAGAFDDDLVWHVRLLHRVRSAWTGLLSLGRKRA